MGNGELVDVNGSLLLAEVDLKTGDIRVIVGGDASLPKGTRKVGRVRAGGPDSDPSGGINQPDSAVAMLVPSFDIDSEELFAVRVTFLAGSQPQSAVLEASVPIPRGILRLLARRCAHELFDKSLSSRTYVKNVAVPILRDRIRQTEQSVRDALADDDLTDTDYDVLREYPHRLARIERLSQQLLDASPTFESFRPREMLVAPVSIPDRYWEGIREVGDDARAAVTRLSGLLSSQAVVLAQRQQRGTERFQRLITFVGAAVLVPGLVAAIFGANVGFRGRDTTSGFWAMLMLMVASGLATYAVLRLFEEGAFARLSKTWIVTMVGGLTPTQRAVLTIVGAALLVLMAGCVLYA